MRSLLLVLLSCLALGGCRCPPVLTPPRFIELEEAPGTEYDYRAATADGVVLAVRELDVDPERGGDLAFWTDATLLQLRGRRGYALLEQVDVDTAAGKGKQLRFGRDEKGRSYRYWLTIVVGDDTLYVIEAGGPTERFDAYADAIAAAVTSLRP